MQRTSNQKKQHLLRCTLVLALALALALGNAVLFSKVANCQPPSKIVRLFSKANAGLVDIVSPTLVEIDDESVVFFAATDKTLQSHTYKDLSDCAFMIIFLKNKGGDINGEGTIEMFQRGTYGSCGKLEIGQSTLQYQHNIAQLEDEEEVYTQELLSIILVRDTDGAITEWFSLDEGRLIIVDIREAGKMRTHQRQVELPSRKVLDGVWNVESAKRLASWTQVTMKRIVETKARK